MTRKQEWWDKTIHRSKTHAAGPSALHSIRPNMGALQCILTGYQGLPYTVEDDNQFPSKLNSWEGREGGRHSEAIHWGHIDTGHHWVRIKGFNLIWFTYWNWNGQEKAFIGEVVSHFQRGSFIPLANVLIQHILESIFTWSFWTGWYLSFWYSYLGL